jgi:16S rRNA G1207 methylase RsmC
MTTKKNSPANDIIQPLINKIVPFRFMGQDLRFSLSHALFSSFDIDAGSKQLLKTIAQRLDLENIRSVLDLGCGVGVLGLSLKKRRPELAVMAVDRDALALEFTTANARLNGAGAEGLEVRGSVGLMHLPGREFDLVVSNLPAKAGNDVLMNVIIGLSRFMNVDGTLAFVIVNTLEELATRALTDGGYQVAHREATREHTVIHARKTRTHKPDLTLEPYIRGDLATRLDRQSVNLRTVFGLPEFDTLSFASRTMEKIAAWIAPAGRVLVWNPGQGYLPLLIAELARSAISFTLAGRDLLSLEISRSNCLANGVDESRLALLHAPSLSAVREVFDRVYVFPDADPGVPWYSLFFASVLPLLAPDGVCLTAAKSTFFGRIDFTESGVHILKDVRSKGYRGIVFRKM